MHTPPSRPRHRDRNQQPSSDATRRVQLASLNERDMAHQGATCIWLVANLGELITRAACE